MIHTWIITDTHWYHDKIVEYCGRPEDYNERTMRNWTRFVGEEDLVYHLGDVIFYEKERLKEILRQLPGNKILVRGGHDRASSDNWFMDAGFVAVVESVVVKVTMAMTHKRDLQAKRVVLSHRPVEVPAGVDYNIHGHSHILKGKWPAREHYLLSLEHVGCRPVRLDKVFVENTVIPSGGVRAEYKREVSAILARVKER